MNSGVMRIHSGDNNVGVDNRNIRPFYIAGAFSARDIIAILDILRDAAQVRDRKATQRDEYVVDDAARNVVALVVAADDIAEFQGSRRTIAEVSGKRFSPR
jgi:hypothetical protein